MKTIMPPATWKEPNSHFIKAINNEWYKNITLIQNQIVRTTFDFFAENNICSVCLPVTSTSITSPMGLGSDSLPVKVNIEGIDTFMSDSMQFHLEYMLRVVNKGVHYLMPSFRGELADSRHLCQFYHSEAEIFGDLNDAMELIGKYIDRLCRDMITYCSEFIIPIAGSTNHINKVIEQMGKFKKITYKDAIEELENNPKFVENTQHGFSIINSDGEKELVKRFGGIVWLTNHYYKAVPFYQSRNTDPKYANNADLLFGIGEVVGAGERCTSREEIIQSLNFHNVEAKDYEWYIKMKEVEPVKTSGFGMGVERFLLFLLDHDDIRNIQPILRFNGFNIAP